MTIAVNLPDPDRLRRSMPWNSLSTLPSLAAVAVMMVGCAAPARYRGQADCEVDQILRARGSNSQWYLPETSAQAPLGSRNADPAYSDCPPMPPDDPTAHRLMHAPSDQPGYQHWHQWGDAPSIESPQWRQFLVTDEEGTLALSTDRCFELGMLHSRQYQTELENVYLTALQLTLERFEFDVQWFGGGSSEYRYSGKDTLVGKQDGAFVTSFLGFRRNFAAGGQLLVNFANTLVWEFTGNRNNLAISNVTLDMVQPLLRGAFRDVRLETLTQAERDVL
jgi:hypothetical protein